jgi:pyruvate formate lyase activating enzyme
MNERPLVGGIVSLTTVDYPNHLSAVIFLQGCTWRCRYCHNQHLQNISPVEALPWEDVLNLLDSRKNFIEAVVFSGGEPLLQDSLFSAVSDVKNMGFKIGLHTSGAFPDKFAKVISLMNWVGFDIKHLFRNYSSITGIEGSGEVARESLEILIDSKVDHEVRMTLYETIEVADVVEALKEVSAMGVRNVALQKCRDKNENTVEHRIFSDKLLLEDISKYFDNFYTRS